MKYRVIVGGILKRNGQLANFNTELDEGELDDATARVKEGYVEEVGEVKAEKAFEESKPSVEPAPVEPAPVEPAPVEPAPVEPAPVEPAPVSTGNDLIDAAKGKKS